MCPLPEPSHPNFEALAAECIRRRLADHGPAPWSICEARLGDDDYDKLCRWAATPTAPQLGDEGGDAGLVLLTFVAEWNRRHSPGDIVFKDLPPLFGATVRQRLFNKINQPAPFFRNLLRRTCQRFRLRHAFGAEQDEDLPYYLSVQLQYGFSLPHAQKQLRNWLCGQRPTEVALRLLEPEGFYRSSSFLRLVRDMKSYRRNWLAESDFRRALRENPWVLPAWENEIVTLIDGIPRDETEDEAEFRLLSDPRVEWEDGPEVWCRVCDLPERLTAPRYLLRHAGRDIVRYYRRRSGELRADRLDVRLILDAPEAIVTLETPDGETIEMQALRLWDPELVAQVRPVGRGSEETGQRLLTGEQVLITSTAAVVEPAPPAWRVVGPAARRRRWWLLDGTQSVRVEDEGLVWNGVPPPPPPGWTSGVSVWLEPPGLFFPLGTPIRFRIDVAPGLKVAHATCLGQPLSFVDDSRTRTVTLPVRAEMSGRCRVRVGVTYGGHTAIVSRELDLPVCAVTWADDGCEIPTKEALSCFEALHRPVRLLSNGPAILIEGREIFGPLTVGRTARVRRVLGTGREVIVADRPLNTQEWFPLARSARDTGFARSLERKQEGFRLNLFRPLAPGARHRLFLWSPTHGTTVLDASALAIEDGGRAWSFRPGWETNTLLAAIAYEGDCVATAWLGEERQFYDPQATDGVDVPTRIALVRWCRLPALAADPDAKQHPLIGRLAQYPLEMVRVAILDQGLPVALPLTFAERQSPRGELFNVIFREAFVRPTQGNLGAVYHELSHEDFDRLLASHPLLGCRALQTVLPQMKAQSIAHTRMLLRSMQLRLLSLTANPDPQAIAQREAVLLTRARATCCEDGEPMDENAVREGLVRPVLAQLLDSRPLTGMDEKNLRTALGVAPFREFLAARVLDRLFCSLY